MTTLHSNRKRVRSVDSDFSKQSKYFVSQRMVNSVDQKYMKTIFDKTVDLLFEGAKNNTNTNQLYESKKDKFKRIRLDGDGNIEFMDGVGKSNSMLDESKMCNRCGKDSFIQSDCSSCNLILCEFCGISCTNCLEAHLCKHCLHLFEGNVNGQPCCRTCKMFT